jgi:hypothetical protein
MHQKSPCPPPPSQSACRTISECRIRSSLALYNGKKLLVHKQMSESSVTEYYIEQIDKRLCVVTYVNHKPVDLRQLDV